MKNMKKIASLLMAMVMVFALAATASAAGNGKIIIKDVMANTKYHAYRILDLSWGAGPDGVEDTKDDTHRYTASTKWTAFVNGADVKGVYLEIDALGTVTWKAGADAKSFAALAEKYAKDNGIAADASKTAPAEVTATTTVVMDGLDLGYYLVDSEGGALCSLDTTNPTAEINEKNDPTDIEKKIKEGNDWVDNNHAEIGTIVEYKATFVKQEGAHGYKVHDMMDKHLDLQEDSIVVYLDDDGSKIDANKVDPANYTIDLAPADGDTFDIAFKDSYITALATGSKIEVYYNAKVTPDVTVGIENGHENKVRLDYGDNNSTEWDKVYTYTYGLDVYKYDPDRKVALEGVEFELYRTKTVDSGTGKAVYSDPVIVHADGVDANGKNVYYVCNTSDHTGTTQTLVTAAAGEFIVRGLDEATYYLLETKALPGYNPLADAIEVKISHNGVQTSGDYAGYFDLNVENHTGVLLPDTGGMGTTIFYVLGSILTLGAFVLFITKRRMVTEK